MNRSVPCNTVSSTIKPGSLAGGLAGLIWPIDEIPADWIGKIKAKEIIEDCLF